MTEPLYTYIRGTGWVLRPPFETRIFICESGATVRLEARMPEIGEVYMAVWDQAYVFSPGVPNLETVSQALLGYTNPITAFDKCTGETLDKRSAEALRYNTIPSWVTIIPLD